MSSFATECAQGGLFGLVHTQTHKVLGHWEGVEMDL